MGRRDVVIEPFDRANLGPNSYDVHLSRKIACYDRGNVLDFKAENPSREYEIPDRGFVLRPGRLYLGVTQEYTETRSFVPFLDGKSSVGRLGIFVHATAGRGDAGFCGHWTLELSVVEQIRIYAGVPIGQLYYFPVHGEVSADYAKRASSKYAGARSDDPSPTPSRMHLNFGGGR